MDTNDYQIIIEEEEIDYSKTDFRYQGYKLLEGIERDENVEELHYTFDRENYGVFITTFLNHIRRKRRFGWLRMFVDHYGFSFLVRKFNLYINAVHNGKRLCEIRVARKGCKFFQTRYFTNYGIEYASLVWRTAPPYNLPGLRIGYTKLKEYAITIRNNLHKRGESFPESGRFTWK